MAEIINLRRVRKGKARDAKAGEAQANRTRHGVAKPVRELARARKDKDARKVDAHKLDGKE
jgi:ribosomal protein L44E